jgi:hypothetical protein
MPARSGGKQLKSKSTGHKTESRKEKRKEKKQPLQTKNKELPR